MKNFIKLLTINLKEIKNEFFLIMNEKNNYIDKFILEYEKSALQNKKKLQNFSLSLMSQNSITNYDDNHLLSEYLSLF